MIVRLCLFLIAIVSSVIYIPNSPQLFPLFTHYIPIINNIKTITRELKSQKKGELCSHNKKMIYDFSK